MQRRAAILGFFVLTTLLPAAALAGPGSGTATITPSAEVVVGSSGTWEITFTAAEDMIGGEVRLIVPDGWTLPQNTSSADSGFVVVTSDDLGAAVQPIVDNVITVGISTLLNGQTITIAYGDDGAGPTARATAPTTPGLAVFSVLTDPSGSSPISITTPPVLNVIAGPIAQLVFITETSEIQSHEIAGPYTIQTQDQYGNPKAMAGGLNVMLMCNASPPGQFSLLGGVDFTAVSMVTIPDGQDNVSFYYKNPKAGTCTLTATAVGQPIWTDSVQQSIAAGPPARFDIFPANATVIAGDFTEYTIFVVDTEGNRSPVSSERTVVVSGPSGDFFDPSDHVTVPPNFTIASGLDSLRVDYQGTTASYGWVHAFTSDLTLSGTAQVEVQAGALSVGHSTVEAVSPSTVGVASQVTVTVRDAYENPISDIDVNLFVASASGNAVPIDPIASTDINGRATGAVQNLTAETVTVTAEADGQLIDDSAQIVFVAGTVSADLSTITADTPVVADGFTASSIVVTARDQNGNPVAGADVELTVNPSGDADLTQPGGVTGPDGRATGTLRSAKTGPRVVKATIDGTSVTDSFTVVFEPGPVARFAWDVLTPNGTAGESARATLTALDAQNNVVTDYTGTVNLSTTSTGVGDEIVEWSAADASGTIDNNFPGDQAQYTFVLADSGSAILRVTDKKAETIQLIAQDGSASGTSSNITITHASADKIAIVTGDGQEATVNTAVAISPRVWVTDGYGNPVFGVTVTFNVIAGGGSVDVIAGGGTENTGDTDTNGEVQCDVWTLGTSAGANTLSASILMGAVDSVDFGATARPGGGTQLDIEPPLARFVTVNSTNTEVTATLRDDYNNPVPEERVDIFIQATAHGTLANNPINPTTQITPTSRWGLTDASGQISVYYHAPATADSVDHVDAFTTSVPATSVDDAVYTATAGGATDLRISFVGGNTVAAGQTFQFVVEAVDGDGNVDTDTSVVVNLSAPENSHILFSESDFGPTYTEQVNLTNGSTGTIYGQGDSLGTWEISADDDALNLVGTSADVVIGDAGAIHHYEITTVSNVTAGQIFPVTVTAKDQFDNTVATDGNLVDLVAVDATTEIPETVQLLDPQVTLAGGRATANETYVLAKQIKIRADDGSVQSLSNTITVNPGAAYQLQKESGDTTQIAAGVVRPLSATVSDAFENPVPNEPVTFVVTEGGGSVSQSEPSSGIDGGVSVNLTTDTVVGNNRVKATILGGLADRETIDYLVSTIADTVASFVVSVEKSNMTAGETIDVDVTALDAYGNVVAHDNTTNIDLMPAVGNPVITDTTGQLVGGLFGTTVTDTIVQDFRIFVQKEGQPAINGISPVVSVSNAAANEIVKTTAEPIEGVRVGDGQPLEVRVQDAYGNPVPDEPVRFVITTNPGGARMVHGIVWTDAFGLASDSLVTSSMVGDNVVDVIIDDGVPSNLEIATYTVTTVAGGIDHYEVVTDVTRKTAGQPVEVTITALDANNNSVIEDSSTEVEISLSVGVGWGPTVETLTAGVIQTTLIDTVAGDIRIRAQTDGIPSIWGESDVLTIDPGVPAGEGTIVVTANPDTITATGLTTSQITTSEIQDQYLNRVSPGVMMTVDIDPGSIDTPDQDAGTPGNQQAVDASGVVSFQVRSDNTVGPATISVSSIAPGSATGIGTIQFAEPPTFECTTDPDPNSVIVGQSYAFRVLVRNTSSTGASLSTLTTFHFSDGTTTVSADLASDTSIAANDTTTLLFNSTVIDPEFKGGKYQPTVHLVGKDEFDASFAEDCVLPAQSLQVSAIRMTNIVVPGPRSIGQTDTIRVAIENPGPDDAELTEVTLRFLVAGNPAGNFIQNPSPDLGKTIAKEGGMLTARVPVTVGAGTAPGTYTVNGRVTADVNGDPVIDDDLAPYELPEWTIQSAVDLSYVEETLFPNIVSQGQTHAFELRIYNAGQATVTFDTNSTILSFSDGVDEYVSGLKQAVAIPGVSNQLVEFKPVQIPAGLDPGTGYNVAIFATGDENGSPFADTLYTGDESEYLTVQTPASIVEDTPDGLYPDRVSTKSSLTFDLNLINQGGATVYLTPANTTISFSTFTATLDPNFTTELKPGPNQITFLAEIVDETIAANTYNPTIHLEGFENGIAFVQDTLLTDSIVVEEAPVINIQEIVTSRPKVTAGRNYEIDVWMVVENSGGATVEFTDASIGFELAGIDRTSEFGITPPDSFNGGLDLSGGGTVDTLTFKVETSSLVTVGNMTITGDLEVRDLNTLQAVFANTDLGGKGRLLVQSQATLSIESITPGLSPVTRDMTVPFEIAMVVRNEGGSDVEVDFDPTNTYLSFSTAGWSSSVRDTFSDGGSILTAGEAGTVVFDIGKVGSQSGPTFIGADIASTELNSNYSVNGTTGGTGLGQITVQDSAKIVISNVQPSRTSLTSGSNIPWQIRMHVTNGGGATIDLLLPDSLILVFDDGNVVAEPTWTKPPSLVGSTKRLLAGQSGELVVDLDNTGTFDLTTGLDKSVDVRLVGEEVSTKILRVGSGSATVTVQEPPNVVYETGDLEPSVVSKGANVEFRLPLTNPDPNAATIELDRANTVFRFQGGFFEVPLKASSPDAIPGGPSPTTLVFESGEIGNDVPTGPLEGVSAHLVWTENGHADSRDIPIPSSDLIVQDAPDLNIVRIIPQRSTVTVGQAPWKISMVLENKAGAAPIGLDLRETATRLSFKRLQGDLVVTPEYIIEPPQKLAIAPDTVLEGGALDTLNFTVNTTGYTTGTIIVSGEVAGTDLNSLIPVFDNTADGGDGSFILQENASLRIVSITPSPRTTATVGQITPYEIKMAVWNENEGGSTVDLSLDTTKTYLTFVGSGDWVYNVESQLAGGGTELGGGEIDTVTFVVYTTGDTPGPTTIQGHVGGTVINTQEDVSDDTSDGGAGTIELQTEANVVITSVDASRTTVTDGSPVTWEISVTVTNDGGADARLELPTSLNVNIPDGSVGFDPVDELDGGGLLLTGNGGTGELTIHVTSTGPFTSWGQKDINIGVDAKELNRRLTFPADLDNPGSIIVQTQPQLTVTGLAPTVVSSGAVVGFEVQVSNSDPLAATATLNRANSRIHFNSGNYSAFLDLTSDLEINGGDVDKTIRFESKLIGPVILPATYDVNVDLFWTENDRSDDTLTVLSNALQVQTAPVLSITQMTTSLNPAKVTAGQGKRWTVTMNLFNGGDAPIDISFDSLKTDIEFNIAGGGMDDTYEVKRPTELVGGGVRIDGHDPGQLVYTVIKTGDSTGVIQISGKVEGVDPFTSDTFTYETGVGGSAVITVQSQALLNITGITTSLPRVTTKQGGWYVRVAVENQGQSDVDLDFMSSTVSFETDTANWDVQQARLPGGGSTLRGLTNDVLLFEVDEAGTPGTWRIDSDVEGTETNSLDTRTATTDTSGYGSILVQSPPSIQLVTTTLVAPRAPYVNSGQSFGVRAEVSNAEGVADAENIRINILKTGDSSVPTDPFVIPSIPAGGTLSYVFPVTAGTAETSDTFTVRTLDALDANSKDPIDPLVPIDSTATANIQAPAVLEVDTVYPAQPNVTRLQTTPWDINVVVKNNGTAPLEIDPPTSGDIKFFLGGVQKIGYEVVPPTTFESGRADWMIDSLGVESLLYTVTSTGAETGTVSIEASLTATDRNSLDSTLVSVNTGTVHVQESSGPFIKSTVTDSTFNKPSASMSVVNTNQVFLIKVNVTVQNEGEAVDSVVVKLQSDGNSAIPAKPRDDIARSIEPGATETYIFEVTADSLSNTLERFVASIDKAISRNTHQGVDPGVPEDDWQNVVIQTPAKLTIDLLTITSPATVSGNTVGTNQRFEVTATMENLGEAAVTGTGAIRLFAPAFTFVDPDSIKSFDLGSQKNMDFTWTLEAPPTARLANPHCQIVTLPYDANYENAKVDTTDATAVIPITVIEVEFAIDPLWISAPPGAKDLEISTDQFFTVKMRVRPSEAMENNSATINVPAGFRIDGTATRDIPNGVSLSEAYEDSFRVQARPDPTTVPDTIWVTVSGTDKTTSDIVQTPSPPLLVEVVSKASLRLSANIVGPPDALDGRVTINSGFQLEASVANLGNAKIKNVTGQFVQLTPPAGYSISQTTVDYDSDSLVTATWYITARSVPSGPDEFVIEILDVPDDKNTDAMAHVQVGEQKISIVTEGATVEMSDVTEDEHIDNKVVPGGAVEIDKFAFSLEYPVNNSSANDAVVKSMSATILDKNGRPLSNSAVSSTLKRLYVKVDGEEAAANENPQTNPVTVVLPSAGASVIIRPDSQVTFVVGVDVSSRPSAQEFRLSFPAKSIAVRDAGNDSLLTVVDAETGQEAIGNKFQSTPLVILSGDFQEYAHNYPNPFQAGIEKTSITYKLDVAGDVQIKIYDMTGAMVREWSYSSGGENATQGPHEVPWDGRNKKGEVIRNGIYVCVIKAGGQEARFRIAVAK